MVVDAALDGLRIVAFEARRAEELARMLERHGARVQSAPALREVPLPASAAVHALAAGLEDGGVAAMVLTTGVGTRALARAIGETGRDAPTLLARVPIVARGPKPLAALRELGLTGAVAVPSPHTWQEILATIDGLGLVSGARIAVQEYGTPPTALLEGLVARGFATLAVAVYRWALPEDTGPLRAGLAAIRGGEADVVVFTSAAQIEHVARIVDDPRALRATFARTVVASIGPVCSEALAAHGLDVGLEADPPKLGPLVALIAARAPAVVAMRRHAS